MPAPPPRPKAPERHRTPPSVRVELIVNDDRWAAVPGLQRIELLASAAVGLLADSPEPHEVAVALGSDDEVRHLNRTYRGKNMPTNVLSFPAAGSPDIGALGDVILAYETCAEEAEERHIPISDHACHLALHGILHLLGQDHEDPDEADAMEGLETRLLAAVGIDDPHSGETFTEYPDETDDEPGSPRD